MNKKLKIAIAGVIILLLLVTMVLMSYILENGGGFTWSLLWDAFICTVISIGIGIGIMIITYLLYDWIEKNS